jgi:hypothetical protein
MRKIFPILLLFTIIFAQTTVNPDISVIGDLIAETDGSESSFNRNPRLFGIARCNTRGHIC